MNYSFQLKKNLSIHQSYISLLAGIVLTMLFFTPAWAETRQHESHVHGVGKLNIGLEGHVLYIELESPAANIVGFEHSPMTQAQKDAVHNAEEHLKDGTSLFDFPAQAQCSLQKTHVSHTMMKEKHEQGDHAPHMDEQHHDRHDAHQHHENGHHQEQAHNIHGSHSEFNVTYRFECKYMKKLTTVDVKLFSRFPGFETLHVQLLSSAGQTALELKPGNSTIDF